MGRFPKFENLAYTAVWADFFATSNWQSNFTVHMGLPILVNIICEGSAGWPGGKVILDT